MKANKLISKITLKVNLCNYIVRIRKSKYGYEVTEQDDDCPEYGVDNYDTLEEAVSCANDFVVYFLEKYSTTKNVNG